MQTQNYGPCPLDRIIQFHMMNLENCSFILLFPKICLNEEKGEENRKLNNLYGSHGS